MNEFYGRVLNSRPSLTPQQERAALVEIDRLKSIDPNSRELKRARDRFIEANLRLVVRIARPYVNSKLYDDLIQAGNIGLIHTLDKFDVSRELRFGTYAAWWVKAHIKRYLVEHEHNVRMPTDVVRLLHRATKLDCISQLKNGRSSSREELEEHLKMNPCRAEEVFNTVTMGRGEVSLDVELVTHYASGSMETLKDRLQGDIGVDVIHEDELREARRKVDELLMHLSDRERSIIKRRFEIDDHELETLQTIGDSFNITRERVRQIMNEAMRKARKTLARAEHA